MIILKQQLQHATKQATTPPPGEFQSFSLERPHLRCHDLSVCSTDHVCPCELMIETPRRCIQLDMSESIN